MKNTDNEELCELMFSTQTKQEILNDERRKNELTQLDLTFLDYPSVNVSTGEIVGYPFEGWSKEEIEEYFDNYDAIIKDIFK